MSYRQWIEEGYRVFPLHEINPDGSCGCGKEDCEAQGKHPTMSNWQHTPVWGDDQLDAFDELGWMASGYGIIVSDGLLVIDVDPRNGGAQGYAQLVEDIPEVAGADFIVETGRKDGGKHIYFKAPAGVALAQPTGGRYPGVDFKSSGYVVGPGSLHASGQRYDIVVGDSPADIGPAPTALIELLKRPDAHRTSLSGEQVDVTDNDLADMVKAIDPDCGHDEWVRVGMALHEITGGTGFAIWDNWSRRGKKYPGQDVLDRRWHSFGKSATRVGYGTLHKYATQAGWQEPVTFDYTPDEEPPQGAATTNNEPAPPKPRHQQWLETLLEPRIERVRRMAAQPWVITDIVPAGGVVSLVGGSGVGKSFVAVDMACAIASGSEWHGYSVEQAGSVVYVAAEGGGGIDKRVLAWAQQHSMDDVPQLYMLLDAPIIDDQKDAALLTETLAELARRIEQPIKMVILDTLNRVMQGEENSATAMAALMRGVEMVRQRLGCAVQIIHHTGHGEQQRARGSSAFFAALDSEITIKKIGKGVVELENTKSKDSEEFEPVRLKLEQVAIEGMFDRKGRPVTSLVPRTMSMVEEGAALGELTDDEAMLLEIIEQIGAVKPYDDDLRKVFYDDIGDMSQRQKREKYRKAVDGLVKKGRIRRDGKDRHGRDRIRVF